MKKEPLKKDLLRREKVANTLGAIAAMTAAPVDTGAVVHDRVSMANANLFDSANYSEPLTNYAVGWKDSSDIEAALNFFAPAVPVSRKFEYRKFDNADDFESDSDDERAIGEDFKVVKNGGEMVLGKTRNRGLKIVVDEDEVDGDPNWRERKVGQLLRRIKRNQLIRAINLLSAAAVNTGKTWNSDAGKDPDNDMLLELIAGADVSGLMMNRVGFGHTAWSKRVGSHRAQDNAGGYASAGLSPAELAGFLNVDEVFLTKSRHNSGSAKAQILSNKVLMFLAENGLSQEDPSNIKRFMTMIDGGDYRVFEYKTGSKFTEIVVEHYEETLITSTLGIRQLTIS